MKTIGYIELIKKTLNASYYRITRMIGVTDTTMDRWRKGKMEASDANAIKIADALHMERADVLLDLDIERAENEEVRRVREWIRDVVKKSALAVLVLFIYTGAAVEYVRCVLCQICYGVRAGTFGRRLLAVFAQLFALNNKNKGLIHEETEGNSLMGRLPHGRGIYLHAMRPASTPQPDRELLVHDRVASEHRARTGRVTRTWAAIGLGLIACSGDCRANWGMALGTVSHHASSTHYNERNPALCISRGFQRFGMGCAYIDSQEKTAAALALGGRLNIAGNFYLGGTFGLTFNKRLNEFGDMVIDPDPMAGLLLTYGSAEFSGTVLLTPEMKDSPEIRYLVFGFGW